MARSRLRIFATAFCLLTGSILVGCGDSNQPPPLPAKPAFKIPGADEKPKPVASPAVAKPISTAPAATAVGVARPVPTSQAPPAASPAPVPPQQSSAQVPAKTEQTASSAPVQASATPVSSSATQSAPTAIPASQTLPAVETDKPASVAPDASSSSADQNQSKSKEEGLLLAAGLKRLLTLETAYSYDPEGKIDPFVPVFDVGMPKDLETQEKPEEPEKRIPQSPIEMVDLSQLKLTGVILAPSGNRALVQDATGKGYVIYSGTYIGNREGQVTKILPDRLIVTEKTRDDLGRPHTEEREIKLPKPPGEM